MRNFFFLLLFFSIPSAAQVYQWTRTFGDNGMDMGYANCTDASNNVYTTGTFSSNIDFDPGPDTLMLSAYYFDIFISKLDENGVLQWAKQIGSMKDEIANDIHVDDSGNVIITGFFTGTLDFDPGPGVYNLISGGFEDCFVCKLDSNGNFVWARQFEGMGIGTSLTTDVAGNVFVTGYYQGTVDFDPGAGNQSMTADLFDIFVCKLDAGGQFVWAQNLGGNGTHDEPYSIDLDLAGNIYITGNFEGMADFDPGPGNYFLSSAGGYDIFIVKLDSNGQLMWANSIGDAGVDGGKSICIDMHGNVIVSGFFSDTTDFDGGPGMDLRTSNGDQDMFVCKYSGNGNYMWAKTTGGLGMDKSHSVSTDTLGNIYQTGFYTLTADMDPGPATYNLTAIGGYADIFITKSDSNGNFIWAKSMGSTVHDFGESIAIDGKGNIYTTGSFFGSVDFNPDAGTDVISAIGATGTDIFIQKLGECDIDSAVVANGNGFTAAQTGAYYQWIDCSNNQPIAGENGQAFTPLVNGMYAVLITMGDCSTMSACNIVQNVGIENEMYLQTLSIYPNPTSGIVNINLGNTGSVVNITVHTITDSALMTKKTVCNNILTLDMSSFPSGIYPVEIRGESNYHTYKVIKQ